MRAFFAQDHIRDVAQAFAVNPLDITGRSKDTRVYLARCAVIARLDKRGWSSVRIGRVLNRHHTSVLHALGRLNRR